MPPQTRSGVDGDVVGGSMGGLQQVLRPGLSLYPDRTGTRNPYLCSSCTPPGGGVHGMAGAWTARATLRDAGRRT